MFNSSMKAMIAARHPLPSCNVFKTFSFLRTPNMRFAVGSGMPAFLTKSELLKIGRSKIQSNAWIAYWERVSGTNCGEMLYAVFAN
jgi:hypothetical protein